MSTRALLTRSLAVILMASFGWSQAGAIDVRGWIDGRSRLILDDDTVLWQHFDFAAPGRLDCDIGVQIQPTYLEGVEWYPTWPDLPTCENRDCNGCTSDLFVGLVNPVPNIQLMPILDKLEGRGLVTLIEPPTAANGHRMVIEFNDNAFNAAAWYEIEIRFGECNVEPYCTSVPNSTGMAAVIEVDGSLSVSATDTMLHAARCPPDRIGVFVYGGAPVQMPFCNGYLCVSPYSPGLFRVPAMVPIDSLGIAETPLTFNLLPSSGAILGGSTWYFQFWFRDGPAGGARANLTNGARVTFCP
jgi:hypothetical protein